MQDDESGPTAASDVEATLSELLAQTRNEPISKELRDMAARLDAALLTARIMHGAVKRESS